MEAKIGMPGLFDLTVHRVAIMTLTLLYFIWYNKEERTSHGSTTPLAILIGVHIVWIIACNITSVVPAISFKRMLSQVIEFYLLYFLLVRIISDERTIKKVIVALFIAMTINTVFGFFEASMSWSVIDLFPAVEYRFSAVDVARGTRIKSVFPHAILFGGALALAIPQAMYLVSQVKKHWLKGLIWVVIFFDVFLFVQNIEQRPLVGIDHISDIVLVHFRKSIA